MEQFITDGPNRIICADNMDILPQLPDNTFAMIYLDPPFNSGLRQRRGTMAYGDAWQRYHPDRSPLSFTDYWSFLAVRLEQCRRVLSTTGTLYLHLDYRQAHYAKVALDELFGRDCFLNEIIWAYDFGGRSHRKWPAKHDTILVYVKDPDRYYFNSDEVDREPYLAPGWQTAERAERGKLPTDVWWHTVVATMGREKTGYPTQKPVALLRRMVAASSHAGDWVADFFAGSGTLGAAAQLLGRKFWLVDNNPEAVQIMQHRLTDPLFG